MDSISHGDREGLETAIRNGYTPVGSAMVADSNVLKLKAVIGIFGLSLKDVAEAGGVSRPYVSRVLSGGLVPSARFLRNLEGGLHVLVERRNAQVFSIPCTSADAAVEMLAAPEPTGGRAA